MLLEIPYNPNWEEQQSLSKEELESIFSSEFTYLDRGAQAFVFASKDDKYVLKLFRYDRALTQKKGKAKNTKEKINTLFNACILAFREAKEETGVLFIHINTGKGNLPAISLRGPLGQKVKLPLDKYRFVIQKKVESFEKTLFDAARKGILNERIDSFLQMLNTRINKGISNLDPSLSKNFGFLDGRAVELDFGNYSKQLSSKEKELKRYTSRLRKWLVDNAPEAVSYLDESTKKLLEVNLS